MSITASESLNCVLTTPGESRLSSKQIEVPSFSDKDLVRWLAKTEMFFVVHGTPSKVEMQLTTSQDGSRSLGNTETKKNS